jgi:hypothetical protein
MCRFVTAALPAKADMASIRKRLGPPTAVLCPTTNASVEEHLEPGSHYFRAFEGHCDCDTVLGTARWEKPSVEITQGELDKLRRKGWTEQKIERWIAQHDELHARRTAEAAKERTYDLRRWQALIDATVRSYASPYFVVLLHMYDGTLEGDCVPIRREVRVPEADVTDEYLVGLEEDVLYRIEGRWARKP